MEVRKKEESRMMLWVLIWATMYMENIIRGIDLGYHDMLSLRPLYNIEQVAVR